MGYLKIYTTTIIMWFCIWTFYFTEVNELEEANRFEYYISLLESFAKLLLRVFGFDFLASYEMRTFVMAGDTLDDAITEEMDDFFAYLAASGSVSDKENDSSFYLMSASYSNGVENRHLFSRTGIPAVGFNFSAWLCDEMGVTVMAGDTLDDAITNEFDDLFAQNATSGPICDKEVDVKNRHLYSRTGIPADERDEIIAIILASTAVDISLMLIISASSCFCIKRYIRRQLQKYNYRNYLKKGEPHILINGSTYSLVTSEEDQNDDIHQSLNTFSLSLSSASSEDNIDVNPYNPKLKIMNDSTESLARCEDDFFLTHENTTELPKLKHSHESVHESEVNINIINASVNSDCEMSIDI